MYSLSTENLGNPSVTSQSTSDNQKRSPDRYNDGFQLPLKRNTGKPPMFTFPNSIPPPINSATLHLFLFLIRPHHRLPEYPPIMV
ncbi:hypothetical protein CEXT_357791 [Caerostris extrusa]|uniref:Uncharacterized protein n=1 Tax=Caerostris extrusa TaxID=172846 RepID=A0AAV4UIQ7_CAEEX|nr:hypothetical protein CEXT_357791 [Caerostris extrusa]